MTTYVDTSALAKWYLNEARSEEFTAWIKAEPDIHISTLTLVEMRCLLARRRRNHEISSDIEQQVFTTLQDDVNQGFLIRHGVDDESVLGALTLLTLVSNHSLRSLDALHLSIARRLDLKHLATADRIMIDAAHVIGFQVISFD